jgi:hypothetical protein
MTLKEKIHQKVKYRCKTPVAVQPIQEADTRRITLPRQPGQNSLKDPIWKIPNTNQDWWSGSSAGVPV